MPTGIYEIHGNVPANELPDRGRMVSIKAPYIPYTTLTKGEMKLALLAEQADIYARAFPENKEYEQAKNMLYSALRAGVSNGVNFVGALYNPVLQQVAKEIAQASRQTRPASRGGLVGRESLALGVRGIGENEFKFDFDHDCVQYARKKANERFHKNKNWQWWESPFNDDPAKDYYKKQKAECKVKIEIEAIVNQRITDASHHVLYHDIKQSYPAITGTAVITKLLFQLGGIAGLANATETDQSLMATWSETSILRRNSTAGVGAIGSIHSSLSLSPDPEAFISSYEQWRNGGGYSNPKKDKTSGNIGEPLTALLIIKLIGAITAAITAAASLQLALNGKKAGAMGSALNYGTPALESLQSDFNGSSGTGSSNTGLIIGAAAVGIYLMTSK